MGKQSSVIKIFRCMICNEHEYTENEVNLLYTEERASVTDGHGVTERSPSVFALSAVEDVKSESVSYINT